MRQFIIGLLAIPIIGIAQDKTVVSVNRVFPKQDKISQFEKALATHAQKYHKGDYSWRVFSIETGPDAGGYQLVEGPTTWDAVDKRGDISAEHQSDWNNNIAPLLNEKGSASYSVYREDLSSIGLTDYSDKIAINHIFPKPGYATELEDVLKKLKATWQASNQAIAVYESSSSGAPQMAVVTRYKQGLKERERNFRAPMKERYEKVNGAGSWDAYQQLVKNMIDHSWSEMLFFKPDLSSK
jgi:quinol monooxygenase YgiN